MEVLVRKFRALGLASAAYVLSAGTLHAAWLLQHAAEPRAASSPTLLFLFTVHRCREYYLPTDTIVWFALGGARLMAASLSVAVSPCYYFLYKRAALRVSDPRFYEDMDWIDRQIQTR